MACAVMFPVLGGLLWSLAGFLPPTPQPEPSEPSLGTDHAQDVPVPLSVRVERRKVAEGPAAGLVYDWIVPAEID